MQHHNNTSLPQYHTIILRHTGSMLVKIKSTINTTLTQLSIINFKGNTDRIWGTHTSQ